MLKIYKNFWLVNWAEQWQYRANLLMYLLYWLVSPVIYLAVWSSIAAAKGSVNGYTANDFVKYYLTLLVVDQVTSNIVIHNLAYKIIDGVISSEIIKPVHPILTSTLVNNISFKALNMVGFLPIWLLLSLLFKPDYSSIQFVNVLMAIPFMMMSFLIGFFLSAAITSIAFYTTRVYSIHEFYYGIFVLFSGQFVPLTLMPAVIQNIAKYLPFQLMIYFPIELILGRMTTADLLQGVVVGLVWLVISYFLFLIVWKRGLRQYSSVGA